MRARQLLFNCSGAAPRHAAPHRPRRPAASLLTHKRHFHKTDASMNNWTSDGNSSSGPPDAAAAPASPAAPLRRRDPYNHWPSSQGAKQWNRPQLKKGAQSDLIRNSPSTPATPPVRARPFRAAASVSHQTPNSLFYLRQYRRGISLL